MTQTSIFVDQHLSDQQLTAGLASAFGLKEAEIRLINDATELAEDLMGQSRLTCARIATEGDFAIMIECYPLDPALSSLNTRQTIQRFCRVLNVRCAISTPENLNDEMWLVDGHGSATLIEIDVDDQTGAYSYWYVPTTAQPSSFAA